MGTRFGTTFEGSTNTDHIRRFIQAHRSKSIRHYAKEIGCSYVTLFNYLNGYTNTSVNIVEAFLNQMGYSLTVVRIDEEGDVNEYV